MERYQWVSFKINIKINTVIRPSPIRIFFKFAKVVVFRERKQEQKFDQKNIYIFHKILQLFKVVFRERKLFFFDPKKQFFFHEILQIYQI